MGRTDTSDLQNLYSQALELHEQNKAAEAVALYERILSHIPDADLVRYNLGLALYALERFTAASTAFLRAAEINPNDPDYWFNGALALKQSGEFTLALAAYEKAHALQPGDPDILYNIGCCHQAAGDRAEAAAAYEKVVAISDSHSSALSNLAYCTHLQGDYERAAVLYRRLLALRPDHTAAGYMLDALEGKNTSAPPPEYVRRLFDGYSENFDQDLLENLSYRVPALLGSLLRRTIGPGCRDKRVVDLGCGTGLSGRAVAEYASSITGVDLSAKMVEEAEKKGCYDALAVGDVVDFLCRLSEPVELMLAADVFTYLGDLEPLFKAASASVQPGGLFCFSTERGEGEGWQLRVTGRYGHSRIYVRRLAEKVGFQVLACEGADIRKERDQWIAGDLYLLQNI